ncbi:uncharacterized protein MELLADRAFT_72751 [Melampsora larici-populina 98AG31]|uniref:Uncharacterized protein n=1 Tax=Melampsora larici-populina (strain 98AG31 / pathotype 3-4-7) TaxID=747676 RepID=F4RYC1_MELLP|nr:uncharacterized protein MELLADRAFT_72751 [Melampsora larici-populina 98AG31]EGG02662.1 hypothetical protein MELLADRAFT_72751 [Melampsora larici-populina 98AG31]
MMQGNSNHIPSGTSAYVLWTNTVKKEPENQPTTRRNISLVKPSIHMNPKECGGRNCGECPRSETIED